MSIYYCENCGVKHGNDESVAVDNDDDTLCEKSEAMGWQRKKG